MSSKKISQLPEGQYRTFAIEAERRGVALTKMEITTPTDIILIGAIDMIRELTERIEALERKE